MPKNKIRFGVLSTAKIAQTQVIPALQQSQYCEVAGIASTNTEKVTQAAADLGIQQVYHSYEDMLADPEIDAIYNPLPNQLHVEYTLKAMEAGKHVLCEKPIGLNAHEAADLINIGFAFPHLKVMEAFMYRFHPQWQKAQELIAQGLIGEVKHVHSTFSYHNIDPKNIRNRPETGGGALMDIGCYCVSFPRLIFGAEPERVIGLVNYDADFGTDNLTSGMMDFGAGRQATFTCSTRMEPFQRARVSGDKGSIEIEIPVNAPLDKPTRIWLQRNREIEEITFPIVNQYTLQGDAFARAILDDTLVPTPLEDAVGNMQVIDALFKSVGEGKWVEIE